METPEMTPVSPAREQLADDLEICLCQNSLSAISPENLCFTSLQEQKTCPFTKYKLGRHSSRGKQENVVHGGFLEMWEAGCGRSTDNFKIPANITLGIKSWFGGIKIHLHQWSHLIQILFSLCWELELALW